MNNETRAFGELFAEPPRNGLTRPKAVRGVGTKMVNMGELFAFPRIRNVSMDRVPLSKSESERFTLHKGDLLFARQSLVLEGAGKCSIFLDDDEPVTFESHITRVRLNANKADPLFYFYYLQSHHGRAAISSIVEQGAGASGIRGSDLGGLKVIWYSPREQRAIAHILGALDEKIELNRRMNVTLEAMTRALFRSWFVNFDPVRVKIDGRWQRGQSLPGLPAHFYDLFPNRVVDSELGEIPEGWEVGTLGDLALHPRRGMQPDQFNSDTPYIALEHMPKRCIALSEWENAEGLQSNKFKFERGEILFGKLRPYFHKVGVAPLDGVCSTDIVVIAPRSEKWFGFVLGQAFSDEFVEYTNAGSTGTKMPRTNWTDMARYSVPRPSERVAEAFNSKIRPNTDELIASIHESRTLATLRDTLLPKLISGELRIQDAERIVGAVV